METDFDLVARATQYLDQQINLEDLEEWLFPRLPFFFSLPTDDAASKLASAIELGRAEMSSSLIEEDEFRESVRALLDSLETVKVRFRDCQTGSGSSTNTISSGFEPMDSEPRVTVVRI